MQGCMSLPFSVQPRVCPHRWSFPLTLSPCAKELKSYVFIPSARAPMRAMEACTLKTRFLRIEDADASHAPGYFKLLRHHLAIQTNGLINVSLSHPARTVHKRTCLCMCALARQNKTKSNLFAPSPWIMTQPTLHPPIWPAPVPLPAQSHAWTCAPGWPGQAASAWGPPCR